MGHALIIEDQLLIALALQDELWDLGYTVAIAATEEGAIASAKERCPDLIMADGKLERGSGVEAVRQICRDRAIPVVFTTADLQSVEQRIEHAILLEKPYSAEEIREAIKSALLNPSGPSSCALHAAPT